MGLWEVVNEIILCLLSGRQYTPPQQQPLLLGVIMEQTHVTLGPMENQEAGVLDRGGILPEKLSPIFFPQF